MHTRLFKFHWNSHNQSFFLNPFILLWAPNWFWVPFVLSHALHPPWLSNCCMGQNETHLRGLPRQKGNWTQPPSYYTARWPTTKVSKLLSMRRKSTKKKFADYIANKMYTSDLNITNDDTVPSVVPLLGQ